MIGIDISKQFWRIDQPTHKHKKGIPEDIFMYSCPTNVHPWYVDNNGVCSDNPKQEINYMCEYMSGNIVRFRVTYLQL